VVFAALTEELLDLEAAEIGVADALFGHNVELCCCASCTCSCW
jgi:hypothetical protein